MLVRCPDYRLKTPLKWLLTDGNFLRIKPSALELGVKARYLYH
ncbi:MAG: hypothetical protein DIU61_002015 [Bacteroidota bacterium]|jgi:hypothetical protein